MAHQRSARDSVTRKLLDTKQKVHTMYNLKIEQKPTHTAFESQEVWHQVSGGVCILPVDINFRDKKGADLASSIPASWGFTEGLPEDVVAIVQDKDQRWFIFKDDNAYLMNSEGKTLRVIHRS